jgi:hypothetical protein
MKPLKPILKAYEQVVNNQYYIGSKLGGTFVGNKEIGYIYKSAMSGGNSYSRTFEQMINKLRNKYWYRRFENE